MRKNVAVASTGSRDGRNPAAATTRPLADSLNLNVKKNYYSRHGGIKGKKERESKRMKAGVGKGRDLRVQRGRRTKPYHLGRYVKQLMGKIAEYVRCTTVIQQ